MYDAYIRSGVPGANQNVPRRFDQLAATLSNFASIDQCLDFHRADPALVMLGKCAVATEIFVAESESKLREELASGPLPDVWLRRLLYLMTDGVQAENAARIFSNVSFICFNYDRAIEVFFHRAMQTLVSGGGGPDLRIWHPYGALGGAGPADAGIISPPPSFGLRRVHPEDILAAARRLRTFTEGMEDQQERDAIRAELMSAQQVIFLGFGFLEANMRLLQLGPDRSASGYLMGTVFKMPDPNVSYVRNLIATSFGPAKDPSQIYRRLELVNLSASDFLWHYGQVLRS
nr:hypothetical protein [Sphingomonas sp.]